MVPSEANDHPRLVQMRAMAWVLGVAMVGATSMACTTTSTGTGASSGSSGSTGDPPSGDAPPSTTAQGSVPDTAVGTWTAGTNVETTKTSCGATTTVPESSETKRWTYEQAPNGDGIFVTDGDCAAKYPDDPASVRTYCLNTFRKQ
jgi:hypothetical protein